MWYNIKAKFGVSINKVNQENEGTITSVTTLLKARLRFPLFSDTMRIFDCKIEEAESLEDAILVIKSNREIYNKEKKNSKIGKSLK